MDAKTIKVRLPPEVAARLAKAWYAAAETSKQQYPDDEKRYQYYLTEAKRLEEQSA